jgi:hypothetical protein
VCFKIVTGKNNPPNARIKGDRQGDLLPLKIDERRKCKLQCDRENTREGKNPDEGGKCFFASLLL